KYSMRLKQMFYAALFVTVFIPYMATGYFIADLAIQLAEVAVVFVFISLIGSTNPRLRIDQAVKYYAVLIVAAIATVGLSVYGI
ncbi:MAG: NADH-quinone oxidoreductase subunit H, partial [Spirochaetota bacterium]